MPVSEQRANLIKETQDSIRRMADFNVSSIVRVEELGTALNFSAGVQDAQRIVDLFKQVSLQIVPDLPETFLNKNKQVADAEYNRFEQILKFTTTVPNPKATRDSLLKQLENAYDGVFDVLWPTIAFSVHRATDFAHLEREARASIQSIADKTNSLTRQLESQNQEAQNALEAIRKVAAEQGVSQQAIYFRDEAAHHSAEADRWLKATQRLTVLLSLYAFAALLIHKIPFLAPTNTFEAAQLAVGKVLVFLTFASFLVLSARNYLAHRHNAIVNRHRQNSLVTYTALVEAAANGANRDIVLTKAAESIFGQQATGFSKTEASDGAAMSLVNVGTSLAKTD